MALDFESGQRFIESSGYIPAFNMGDSLHEIVATRKSALRNGQREYLVAFVGYEDVPVWIVSAEMRYHAANDLIAWYERMTELDLK